MPSFWNIMLLSSPTKPRRSRCRSNCTWPFGWVLRVILSQRPTPCTREYSTNRFCGETYVLAGVLKIQDFKLCFGEKSFALGKKMANLRKEEDRWSQPAPTVGPTAPTVGPMQVTVHLEVFNFFWRLAKSVLISTVRRWNVKKRKKKRRKRNTVAKGKEKRFL